MLDDTVMQQRTVRPILSHISLRMSRV